MGESACFQGGYKVAGRQLEFAWSDAIPNLRSTRCQGHDGASISHGIG